MKYKYYCNNNMDNYRTSFERDGFVLLDKYLTDEESNLLGVFADRAYNLDEVRDSYMKYYEKSSNGDSSTMIDLDSKYNLANPIK